MDSFEWNKILAAVVLALLVGMVGTLLSSGLISSPPLEKNVFVVEVKDETPTASGSSPKVVEPIEGLLATANIENGEKLAKKVCAQCHSFEKGGIQKTGPNLWGGVGAPLAHKEGFPYSKAFKEKGGTWTFDSLNKFLTRPRDFISGTKMSFVGLSKPQDRADVIAFLRKQSDTLVPLP